MNRIKLLRLLGTLLLAGCQAQSTELAPAGMGMGPGIGLRSGLMR